MRNATDIAAVMEQHGDTVLRTCSIYFGSHPEREDAFQEAFLKYALSDKTFSDTEHVKAWLITVASNTCKDMLRKSESRTELKDDFEETDHNLWNTTQEENENTNPRLDQLFSALSRLDERSRLIMYMMYYEEYSGAEIAKALDMQENAVYTAASRARKKLREVMADAC